jgi:hypothetical protein
MRRTFAASLIVAAFFLLLLPSPAAAQLIMALGSAPGEGKGAKVVEQVPTSTLVLQPADEPREALKYQLLPPLLDRTPGNAALQYGKLALIISEPKDKDDMENVGKWLDMPLDKMPREQARQMIQRYQHRVLDDLDAAARRDRCDWDLRLREGNYMRLLLPELQPLRSLARLVALKARLEVADRKFDEALHTLQTGYAMARHVGQGGTLIHGLVGVAIAQSMSAQVQELLQQPGAANLYWALTALPQPLVDLRPALETELNGLYLWLPALRAIKEANHDVAFWQHLLDTLDQTMKVELGMAPPAAGFRGMATLLALRGYPIARRALIEQGRSPAEVEAMPVPEVVLLYTVQTYNELRDRMFKWTFLPYPQARAGMQEAERYLKNQVASREIVPLASVLMPACGQVNFSVAKSERSFAMLRTIEALRMYAARHEGRLPEKLSDVTDVPVPLDPTSGQAFTYQRNGDTAVLESPHPPGRSPRDGLRVEVRIKGLGIGD